MKLQSYPNSSGVEIDGSSCLKKWRTFTVRSLLKITKVVEPQGSFDDWIRIMLFVIAISVDPLFFYVPVIVDDKKCLALDLELWITVFTIRLLCDLFQMVYILFPLLADPWGLIHEGHSPRKDLLNFIPIDFLITFPLLPMVPDLIVRMRNLELLDAVKLLKLLILIQYLPRVIKTYSLFTKATSGKLAEAIWARVAFNVLLYLQAANVFGGLWYLMAIERETECWKAACIDHTGRSHCSFNCHGNLEDYTFLNGFCPTKTQIPDFGIFHDALKSGIVEETNFLQKFLYCLLWGLKSLSNLGQNLQPSTDVGENLFVISIVISNLVLLALVIGSIQTYLLSRTVRSKEMIPKAREIEEWEPFLKLSKKLQQEVKKHQQYMGRKTIDIDVENVLNNLPMDLRKKVKRELCLKLLRKVREFKELEEETLDALCDCVKPTFFVKNSQILREGDPIDDMIFVVQGKLWTYTFKDRSSTGSTSTDDIINISKRDYLIDGDFYGEELLHWALENGNLYCIPSEKHHLSDTPKSTRTIQALTNVEAFTLMADDLMNVFITFRFSCAARVIQLAWGRHRTRRTSYQGELTNKGGNLGHGTII